MQTNEDSARGARPVTTGRMGLEGAQAALCSDFLGWQCRLRQMAMRHDGGRPSPGMRPRITLTDGRELPPIVVLITKREPDEVTAQFRHMVLKTNDPADRYANAIRLLQAGYYQHPEEFSDVLSALFSPNAELGRVLREAGNGELLFHEHNQVFKVRAEVRALDESHPIYQATYWHNRLFNPSMPGGVEVLAFLPDWSQSAFSETDAEGR